MLHHLATHICQPEIAAGVAVGEPLVIETQQVQHRGVQVVDVNRVLNRAKAEFIRGPSGLAATNSGPREPHRKTVPVVVTPGLADAFTGGRAAEFTAPYEKGFIPKTPLLEVCYQSRSGSPRDPWLDPDVNDVIRQHAARGTRALVLSPVGFVCDHVEVLYDLDVEAKQIATELGITVARARAANDHPAFIDALCDLVVARLSQTRDAVTP